MMKKSIIVWLICCSAALADNYLLTGRPIAIGNDGAIEGEQNPAYLAYPAGTATFSVANYNNAYMLVDFKQVGLTDLTVDNSLAFSGSVGFAYHDLMGRKLSLGLGFSNGSTDINETSGATDNNRITFSNIKGGGKFDTSSFGLSTFSNSADLELKNIYTEGYITSAYKLNRENSLGLTALFGIGENSLKTNIDISLDQSRSQVLVLDDKETLKTTRVSAIAGYVNKTSDGEIGVRVRGLTYDIEKINHTATVNNTLTSPAVNTTEDFSTSQSIIRQPRFSLGVKQAVIKSLKVYVDGTVSIPITYRRTRYEYVGEKDSNGDFVNLARKSEKQTDKFGIDVSFGAAYRLTELINLYAGIALVDHQYEVESFDNNLNVNKFKTAEMQAIRGTLGASFFNDDPLNIFVGAEFARLLTAEATTTGNSSSGNTSSGNSANSRIGVSLGIRYALQ